MRNISRAAYSRGRFRILKTSPIQMFKEAYFRERLSLSLDHIRMSIVIYS